MHFCPGPACRARSGAVSCENYLAVTPGCTTDFQVAWISRRARISTTLGERHREVFAKQPDEPAGSGRIGRGDAARGIASRVLLYAATPGDDTSASAAASAAGLSASAVTEDFATAWAAALTGNYQVIAVGQAADDALYFNTCGWANPSGEAAGGTPFDLASEPLDQLPGADLYENAAAATQTPSLAVDLAYYATHGTLPAGVTALPAQSSPAAVCAGSPG